MKLKKTTATTPEAKILSYSLNPETGWYYQTSAYSSFVFILFDGYLIKVPRAAQVVRGKTWCNYQTASARHPSTASINSSSERQTTYPYPAPRTTRSNSICS